MYDTWWKNVWSPVYDICVKLTTYNCKFVFVTYFPGYLDKCKKNQKSHH